MTVRLRVVLSETDPYVLLLIFSLVVFAVSLIGAYIPFVRNMNTRQVHLMVALSAGIFLGILFFMLLPETFEESEEAMDVIPWMIGGFMAVLLVDAVLKKMHLGGCSCECTDNDHRHELTSFSAFIGLAVHATVDGIIISVGLSAGEEIGFAALIGVALHKFVELFSLSSTFRLTNMDKRRTYIYMIAFSLITPIAAIISMPIVDIVQGFEMFIPLAIATGTFMYVGICALVPEAFHEQCDSIISYILIMSGIMIIAVISLGLGLGAHVH